MLSGELKLVLYKYDIVLQISEFSVKANKRVADDRRERMSASFKESAYFNEE